MLNVVWLGRFEGDSNGYLRYAEKTSTGKRVVAVGVRTKKAPEISKSLVIFCSFC